MKEKKIDKIAKTYIPLVVPTDKMKPSKFGTTLNKIASSVSDNDVARYSKPSEAPRIFEKGETPFSEIKKVKSSEILSE